MTRNGKIARLPYDIREELNRRLRDGKSGRALLKWLNEQEECLEVLDEEFDGRPITKQNLSEWKQGGYEQWVRKEETRERVQVLMEKAEDLERDAGAACIGDRVATLLEVELAVATEQLNEIKDHKERWARLKEITRELSRLRREDHHARKLRMAEEQYERREKEAETRKLLELQEAVQNKRLAVSLRGGGDEAWKWTDWEIRVAHGLPMPVWWTNPTTAEEWSRLMMPYWREEAADLKRKAVAGKQEGKKAPSAHPSPQSHDATRRNSKDQVPKGAKGRGSRVEGNGESHGQDARATKAKSKRVRPGQTKSKSGAGRPIEENEAAVHRQENRADSPSTQRSDARREVGAPVPAETSGMGGMGSTGDTARTVTASPNGVESVKPGPAEDEDGRDRSDCGAPRNEDDSGGNAT